VTYFTGVGEEVAKFAAEYIIQTKGRWAGQPLVFEPWQRALLDELFLVDANGDYIYREALIGVARKNGKSCLASALALYMLTASGEAGAEVYSAAASRDQARVVFDQARAFVEASPGLQDFLKPMRSAIVCESTGGIYRALSAEGALQHGLNPHCVIMDELWAFTTPSQVELYYALTTGQLARENPLIVSITTAGYDPDSICGKVYERGRSLKTTEEQRAARFLFSWHQAPDGCDLDDEQAWRQANPASWIALDDLRHERKRLPEHVYRRLHLNEWTASEEAWLPEGRRGHPEGRAGRAGPRHRHRQRLFGRRAALAA
jgi:phage terminase large subunit-like protein